METRKKIREKSNKGCQKNPKKSVEKNTEKSAEKNKTQESLKKKQSENLEEPELEPRITRRSSSSKNKSTVNNNGVKIEELLNDVGSIEKKETLETYNKEKKDAEGIEEHIPENVKENGNKGEDTQGKAKKKKSASEKKPKNIETETETEITGVKTRRQNSINKNINDENEDSVIKKKDSKKKMEILKKKNTKETTSPNQEKFKSSGTQAKKATKDSPTIIKDEEVPTEEKEKEGKQGNTNKRNNETNNRKRKMGTKENNPENKENGTNEIKKTKETLIEADTDEVKIEQEKEPKEMNEMNDVKEREVELTSTTNNKVSNDVEDKNEVQNKSIDINDKETETLKDTETEKKVKEVIDGNKVNNEINKKSSETSNSFVNRSIKRRLSQILDIVKKTKIVQHFQKSEDFKNTVYKVETSKNINNNISDQKKDLETRETKYIDTDIIHSKLHYDVYKNEDEFNEDILLLFELVKKMIESCIEKEDLLEFYHLRKKALENYESEFYKMLVSIRGSKKAKSFADVQKKRKIEETKQISQILMNLKKETVEGKREIITTESPNKEDEKKPVEGKKKTNGKSEKSKKTKSKESTPSNKKNESIQNEAVTQEVEIPTEDVKNIVKLKEEKEKEKEIQIEHPIEIQKENETHTEPRLVSVNLQSGLIIEEKLMENEKQKEKIIQTENELKIKEEHKEETKEETLRTEVVSEKQQMTSVAANDGMNENINSMASISCDKEEKKEKKKVLLTPWEKMLRDNILKPMKTDPQGIHFRIPVLEDPSINETIKQEYKIKIEKPMDYTTISKKLLDRVYQNPDEFYNDFQLIYKNCFDFNPNITENQYIIEAATKNKEKFESLWNKWKDKVFSCFNEVHNKVFNIDSYFEFFRNLTKKKKKYSFLYSLWVEYLISCQVQFDYFCKARNINWEELNEGATEKVNIKETPLTNLKRCNKNNALYQIFREEFQFIVNLKKKEKAVDEKDIVVVLGGESKNVVKQIARGETVVKKVPEGISLNLQSQRILEREVRENKKIKKEEVPTEEGLKTTKTKQTVDPTSIDNTRRVVLRINKNRKTDWNKEKQGTPKSKPKFPPKNDNVALFEEQVFNNFIKHKPGVLMKQSTNMFRAECYDFENIENHLRKLMNHTFTNEKEKEKGGVRSNEQQSLDKTSEKELTESQRRLDFLNAIEQREGLLEREPTNYPFGHKRLFTDNKVQFSIKKKKLNSSLHNIFEELELGNSEFNPLETNLKEFNLIVQKEQEYKKNENQLHSNLLHKNTSMEEGIVSNGKIKEETEEFYRNFNKDNYYDKYYNMSHVFNHLEPDNKTQKSCNFSITMKCDHAIWYDFILKYSHCFDTSYFHVPQIYYHHNFDEDFSFFMLAPNSLNVFLKIETDCIDLIPNFYFEYINISIISKNLQDRKIGLCFSRKTVRQNMMQKLAHCFKYLNSNISICQMWNMCKCANTLSYLLSQLTTYIEEIDAFVEINIDKKTNVVIIHILKYKTTPNMI